MSQVESANKQPRRRFKRVPQYMPVSLRINDDGLASAKRASRVRGIATDLGPGGMQLMMGDARQIGTHLTIEITLDGSTYTVGGIVRHLRWFSATPGMMFGHGVEIVEASELAMRAIVKHLATYMARGPAALRKAA